MNNTVTYQITIQPWQVAEMVTLRLSRASYNKHGRQLWSLLHQLEARPDQLEAKLQELSEEVLVLEANWRVRNAANWARAREEVSDPAGTLGGDGGE
jgi:hypothetical protein